MLACLANPEPSEYLMLTRVVKKMVMTDQLVDEIFNQLVDGKNKH